MKLSLVKRVVVLMGAFSLLLGGCENTETETGGQEGQTCVQGQCNAGLECVNNICVKPDQCSDACPQANDLRCSSDAKKIEVCSLVDGCLAWQDLQFCLDGATCILDNDIPTCDAGDPCPGGHLCSPIGETKCDPDADRVLTCQAAVTDGCDDWTVTDFCLDDTPKCNDDTQPAQCVCADECDLLGGSCVEDAPHNCVEGQDGCLDLELGDECALTEAECAVDGQNLAYCLDLPCQRIVKQAVAPSNDLWTVQNNPLDDDLDVFRADDFVLAAETEIHMIQVPGKMANDGSLALAESFHWEIYPDDGNKPAGVPGNAGQAFWQLSLPPSDSKIVLSENQTLVDVTDIFLTIDPPLTLAAGTWWFVFYPTITVAAGEFGLKASASSNGLQAQIIYPAGAGGQPSTWSVDDTMTEYDLAFFLHTGIDCCVDACVLDQTRCVDTAIEKCVMGAKACTLWQTDSDCADSQELCRMVNSAAQCSADCDDECDVLDQTRCLGSVAGQSSEVQTCSPGADLCLDWVTTADCSQQDQGCQDLDNTPAECVAPTLANPGTDCSDTDNMLAILVPADLPASDINQTTCGKGNNFEDDLCLFPYDDGEDIIYELTVTQSSIISITMNPKNTEWTGFGLEQGSCPAAESCAPNPETSNNTDIYYMNCTRIEPGSHFLIVDTFSDPDYCIPDFDLLIEECTCEAEAMLCLNNQTVAECGLTGDTVEKYTCGDQGCGSFGSKEDCLPIIVESLPYEHTGQLLGTGRSDYYQIQLAAAAQVTISTSKVDEDVDTVLELYDDATELITENDDDDNNAPFSLLENQSLQAGTYYVRVKGWDDDVTGAYLLNISAQ